MNRELRVGTRGSRLARCQTEWVIELIRERYPELTVREVVMATGGDRNSAPLPKIGGKGLFTRELEEALLGGEIDCAVHSLKDLPTELPAGLIVGAVPLRANPLDIVVTGVKAGSLREMPAGSVIGTSSPRRAAQLRIHRPDLVVRDIRGNLDTRLRKLAEGEVDALVVAAAGLERLGLQKRTHGFSLPPEVSLPAPGQGALAVEVRREDPLLARISAAIEDKPTRLTTSAERAMLTGLGGGCQVPVGALAELAGNKLILRGIVAQTDGRKYVGDLLSGTVGTDPEAAREIGFRLAEALISKGAKEILDLV